MSFTWYSVGISTDKEGLDPLLPHIAGVIENMEEATVAEIQSQVERDLNTGISVSAIINAVENGVRLGLFKMERQFKVCREFTSKDFEKLHQFDFARVLPNEKGVVQCEKQEDTLMEYVKMQREKRRKKLLKRKTTKRMVASDAIWSTGKEYSQLCERCKQSIEKKLVEQNRSGTSEDKYKEREPMKMSTSSESECSEQNSEHSRKAPQKSKLLIEKNPMETDQPYCDIFT